MIQWGMGMISRLDAIARAGYNVIQQNGYVYLTWKEEQTRFTNDIDGWEDVVQTILVDKSRCFGTVEEAVSYAEFVLKSYKESLEQKLLLEQKKNTVTAYFVIFLLLAGIFTYFYFTFINNGLE